MKITFLISFILFWAVMPVRSGTTGAQFLRIDTDARISGMGAAGGTSALGLNSLNYNPAGLTGINTPEVVFSHCRWLMDSSHDFIGFGMPVKIGALGIGVMRLSNSSLSGRDEVGGASGGYDAYDQVVSIGFGHKNVGGAVKYIQSRIAEVKAEAFAVDIGVRRNLRKMPVSFGFGVQNLGAGIKYLTQRDNLPLSVNAGLTVSAFPGVGLALDIKRLVYERETVFSAGTEYAVMVGDNLGFALRGGYGLTGEVEGYRSTGLSVGAGIIAMGAQLDYAVSPETGLGSIHRVTLKKKF